MAAMRSVGATKRKLRPLLMSGLRRFLARRSLTVMVAVERTFLSGRVEAGEPPAAAWAAASWRRERRVPPLPPLARVPLPPLRLLVPLPMQLVGAGWWLSRTDELGERVEAGERKAVGESLEGRVVRLEGCRSELVECSSSVASSAVERVCG